MRINNVVGFTSGNVGRNIAFGRAPKKGNEEREYRQTIQSALDYLGIQNQAMVIHAPSFPAQGDFDVEIGSFVGADELVEFAKLHGFDSIQLGPNGKLNRGDTSPYTSSIFEKNPLFINVSQLTTKDFASILSNEEIKKNAKKVKETGKNFDRTDYKDATKNVEALMDIAFGNFNAKLAQNDPQAKKLNAEFEKFKNQNSAWIEYYAVLDILGRQYGTDFYPNWKKEDQDLIQDVKKGNSIAKERFAQIQKDNTEQIEKYKFSQFIIAKQTELDNKKRKDFVFIGDLEVGASSLDELVFKDVFLPDFKLGCKYGGVANSPQLWGIAVPDPNKLFNKDGSLGPAGYYIKAKIQNGLAGAQNIRIDHVMGLVNPYVINLKPLNTPKKWKTANLLNIQLEKKCTLAICLNLE